MLQLKDLLGFISLMVVVILGVGFYYHANLWPDHAEFWKGNWAHWRIWKVLYYPYWQMYGESFNEYLAGRNSSVLCTHFFCLFVCLWFSSHSRIFNSYGDDKFTGEGLQILTCARHSCPLSSDGSLVCHNLL